MAAFNLANLAIGEVAVSGKGAKSASLSYNGAPVTWQPGPSQVVYEPSSFNGEEQARVNLVMRATTQVEEQLTALDEKIVQMAILHSVRLFGKALTPDEIRLKYNPCLKRSEKGYCPTFKAKVTLGKLRCWDMEKERRAAPAAWTQCSVTPLVQVKALWFLSKEFGVLCEIQDLIVDEASQECPL